MPVAILSYGMWQRLGGTDAVLGSTVKINGRQFKVVGVAPRGFGGSMVIVSPELYVPTGVYNSLTNDFLREGLPATLADRRHHALILIARLEPGATIESMKPALEHAGAQLEQAFPGENQNQDLLMAPLSRMSVSTSPQTDDGIGVARDDAVLDVRTGAARGVVQSGEHAARARQCAAEGIRHPSRASAAAGSASSVSCWRKAWCSRWPAVSSPRSWPGGPRER